MDDNSLLRDDDQKTRSGSGEETVEPFEREGLCAEVITRDDCDEEQGDECAGKTTPSVCEKKNVENTEIIKGSRECGVQDCVGKDSMNEDTKTQNECVFDKKGMCSRHGVMGRKLTRTKGHWTKKKDGTYGNKWKKEKYFICMVGRGLQDSSTSRGLVEHDHQIAQKIEVGKADNFDNGAGVHTRSEELPGLVGGPVLVGDSQIMMTGLESEIGI